MLGIGLNVNQTRGPAPGRHASTPASLSTVDGVGDRAPILADLLRLERRYDAWVARAASRPSSTSIGSRDFLRGRRVLGRRLEGVAAGSTAGPPPRRRPRGRVGRGRAPRLGLPRGGVGRPLVARGRRSDGSQRASAAGTSSSRRAASSRRQEHAADDRRVEQHRDREADAHLLDVERRAASRRSRTRRP